VYFKFLPKASVALRIFTPYPLSFFSSANLSIAVGLKDLLKELPSA